MGNHEYCEECGESDFHLGRKCYPKKVAKVKAREAEVEMRLQACITKLKADMKTITSMGYSMEINTEYGCANIWPK